MPQKKNKKQKVKDPPAPKLSDERSDDNDLPPAHASAEDSGFKNS